MSRLDPAAPPVLRAPDDASARAMPAPRGPDDAKSPVAAEAALLAATLGLLARASGMAPAPAATGRSGLEAVAPVLQAALAVAPRDPALLGQLSAALGRLSRPRREG